MTYVYLIESVYHQGHRYIGITDDLRRQIAAYPKIQAVELGLLYCLCR